MHTWVFGNPDTGKREVLINEAIHDMEAGNGLLFVDTQGSAIDALLRNVPSHRTADVLHIDPSDIDYPVGMNLLYNVPTTRRPYITGLFRDTIKALWDYASTSTPVMDRMIYNTIAALLEYPGATLLHIELMLTDREYAKKVLEYVSDPVLTHKWNYWFSKTPKDWNALISSTENKAGEFSEDPRIRHIIGQARSTFDLKQMLFEKKIILLNLSHGELGAGKAKMLGSLFLAAVLATAASRKIHIPFNIYIPNCHHFDTPILPTLLSDGARLGLSITVTNQYLAQLSPALRSSLLGQCQKRIIFRTGFEDSEYLHKTIKPDNNLPRLHEIERFMPLILDSKDPRTERTYPAPKGSAKRRKIVITQSRRAYGTPREQVEAAIARLFT